MSCNDNQDPSIASDVQRICNANMNQKPSCTVGRENASPNPLKKKINPLELLICLRTLINANGAIKSIDEVQRVAGLMGKYSKKLVSKCIYLNILQATEEPLLDEFYKDTGWNLICAWLTESVATRNYPLAQQILSLLLVSPISIDRLKRNNIPKMVKVISKDCPHALAQKTADEVVQRWKELVKGCTMETVENNSLMDANMSENSNVPFESDAVYSSLSSLGVNSSDTTQDGNLFDTHKLLGSQPVSQNDEKAECFPHTNEQKQLPNSSSNTSTHTNTIEQKEKRGTKRSAPLKSSIRGTGRRGRARRKRSIGRGRGKAVLSYAELLCQDSESGESASESTEKEKISTVINTNTHSSVPRLRIKIRNVGTKRPKNQKNKVVSKAKISPVEWTDSEDDQPLSKIRDERQKEELVSTQDAQMEVSGDLSDDEEVRTKKKSKQNIIDEDDSDVERKKDISMPEEKPKVGKGKDKTVENEVTDKEKEEKRKCNANDVIDTKEASKADAVEKEEKQKGETSDMAEKEGSKQSIKKTLTSVKGKYETAVNEEKEDKRSGENEQDQKDKRKKSHHGEEKSHRHDRDKKHKSSREKEKEKEKKKSERNSGKDKSKETMSRRTSDDKGKERQREQERKDKATLDKVKPLSTEGLAKIPRKAATFMDALGSADVTETKSQNTSVKHKSRISRHTGPVDDTIKSSHSTIRKPTDTHSPKRLNLKKEQSEVRKKENDALSPSEKFAGSKLTSPKRSHLSDDGGFMAALTAAGAERKKISRKRKSSETDLKQEGTSLKSPKAEEFGATANEVIKKDDLILHSKNTEEETDQRLSEKCEEDSEVLSPTSVTPTLNFYKETLQVQEDPRDGSTVENASCITDDSNSAPESVSISKSNGNDTSIEHSSDENKKDDNMEIEELDDVVKDQDVDVSFDGGNGNGISLTPVPAPTNEEYEKIEVTFTAPLEQLKSALVYHRSQNRAKKGVSWRPEAELKETFFFPMDETERVNVNTIKFNEMMLMEKAKEKELMIGKQRGLGRLAASSVDRRMHNNCLEFGPYKLYPVHLPNPPNVTPGYKSMERHVQAQREHATMATFFHPSLLPDTPTEPDPEMVQRTEPVAIPLSDVGAGDCVTDNRGIPWPEPLFTIPELPFVSGSSVSPQCPPQQSGGHWVLGNHSVSRFSVGSPMFPGPNGPPGPGGSHGPFGPPPQGYLGDMRGNWGGPGDFGGPPVIMANGPPHMPMHNMVGPNPGIQGGPPIQGVPGPGPGPGGPRPSMGIGAGPLIGARDSYQPRYRRGHGGGGSWGGSQGTRGYCKHFRNGHCRHGDDCLFLHVPS